MNEFGILIEEDGTQKYAYKLKVSSGSTSEGVVNLEAFYTNLSPTPEKVGGIVTGSTFDNVSVSSVLDQLLYPYQNPSFTSLTISGLSVTTYELGYTFPTGDYVFNWTTSNSTNITTDSIRLNGVSSLTNDGTETQMVADITKNTIATHTFSISALNTLGNTISRNLSLYWKPRVFYGESAGATINEAEVEALRVQSLSTTFSGSYSFLGGGYKYIVYPKSFGLPTTFKDPSTNLDVAMSTPQELNITNNFGVTLNYYALRTKFELGGAITINVS